jgi:hypothetical protein
MRAKLINESLEDILSESKKDEKESYSLKKSEDKELEILNSNKESVKKGSPKEMIEFLSKFGLSHINSKSLVDDILRGDIKIKVFIANPKIFKSK